MNEIIAKKYVGALLDTLKPEEIAEIDASLRDINSAFSLEKFKDILAFPASSDQQKAEFVLSMTDCQNANLKSFLSTLAKAKRLDVLPQIYKEFSYQKALRDNTFVGVIYSSFDLSEEYKKELEEKFSKKLNANIHFEAKKSDYDGIKIELADLGFEASFSMSLFKSKLNEYILKAI